MKKQQSQSIKTRFKADFPSVEKNGTVGKITAAIALPVAVDEIVLCEGAIDLFQSMLFQRFQIRAFTKSFYGLLFLVVPILLNATPTRYLPGYVNPLGEKSM